MKKMTEEFEWNHEDLQELVTWVQKNTPQDSVVVSEMVLTAIVSLSTDRAVTNHPHYESYVRGERRREDSRKGGRKRRREEEIGTEVRKEEGIVLRFVVRMV
jgi:hypothetical protein